MENESVEHGPAMLVLFSNSAIKYIDDRDRLSKNAVALLESIREPSSDREGEVMQRWPSVVTEAVVSVRKGKVGEGKLFWLTAYLQLDYCILKYFSPE